MGFTDLLKQTCTIYTHNTTTDAYGDKSLTWLSVATGVKCRVQPKRAPYKATDEIKYTRPAYVIYIEAQSGLNVNEGDRIEVTSLSQDFIATFAKLDSSLHHWEIEAEDMDTIN